MPMCLSFMFVLCLFILVLLAKIVLGLGVFNRCRIPCSFKIKVLLLEIELNCLQSRKKFKYFIYYLHFHIICFNFRVLKEVRSGFNLILNQKLFRCVLLTLKKQYADCLEVSITAKSEEI